MKLFVSVPDREIVECELPSLPSIGHSVALDRDGVLYPVIGVVWDFAPPTVGAPLPIPEIWVFCDAEGTSIASWTPKVISFPKGGARA